jgi:hypothetical protein
VNVGPSRSHGPLPQEISFVAVATDFVPLARVRETARGLENSAATTWRRLTRAVQGQSAGRGRVA